MGRQVLLNNLIDHWILLRLMQAPDEIVGSTTGIYNRNDWIKAQLRGVDAFGIWLENPHFKMIYFIDSEGNSIPAERQEETIETVLVFIKWEFVASIIGFDADVSDKARRSMNFATLGQELK